jgi:Icc protein
MKSMDRREFVKQVGLGLAAGWAVGRVSWPFSAAAAGPEMRLALVADAHLKDGNDRRPEALALARAVAEIRSLSPPPDLVLFAGDLAHRGRPDALDLGREILADLPAHVWAVRGEGDHGPGEKSAWVRRWGEARFSRAYRDCRIIGLDTAWRRTSRGAVFEIGAAQRRWLARELDPLSPSTPLIILSHAPLARLFHPWQQWTGDAPEVAHLLARFPQVLCLHGHVHGTGAGGEGKPFTPTLTSFLPPGGGGNGVFQTQAAKMPSSGIMHYGLPATSFPQPLAVQGTPASRRPGLGPRGCGWALATLSPTSRQFQPYLWQA